MLARSALVAWALLLAPEVGAAALPKPRIVELVSEVRDGGLVVSFRVESAFSDDCLERIASGMQVEFRHRIDLVARRPIPVWPSHVLCRVEVAVAVHYDSLTRQYRLTRTIQRKVDGDPVEEGSVVAELSTSSEDEARDWMTRVEAQRVELPPPDSGGRALRLRLRSWLGRRVRFFLFPMSDAADAELELAR